MKVDGLLVQGPRGLFRVVDPPWWRIDRWIRWYVGCVLDILRGRRVRARGFVTLQRTGVPRVVRVEAV